ncbi:(2Fe-2S)-binding protein [Streptomyces sp. SCSIO 30461]|uniref:(2Fe-2S)-binding protein n=1 Tax=Streptomyces sp. SCSIO 30461 TaxID=3118085 RepID=UPI0030D61916
MEVGQPTEPGERVDLDEPSSIGGFFALHTGAPGSGHTALSRLYGGDLTVLTTRVDRVASRLGTPERRVAASIAHLGLAARLWSTALGAAVLCGEFPDPAPDTLHWDPELGAPTDLCWSGTQSRPGTVDALREAVLEGQLIPLAEAVRADARVSPRLLRGNAGSALAGALRELVRWSRSQQRPDVSRRAAELAAGLLEHPELSGTVRGPALRRTTCCLYYRSPGGGLCGDCVFDSPPTAAGGTHGL